MATDTIEGLLGGYREGAEGTSSADPRVANRWQRQMHVCYKQLRETPEGRAAIITLMDDPSPHVRCWAGGHCLQWEPIKAKRTLVGLREARGPCSFDADITLEEFNQGRLSFDY